MVTASVDITALKARHPLGDTVEAAGVRLRGRGRVRQGVCPFHDEAEGSFTVYGDSERFYCFGCGLGGDVLDFIQQVRGPVAAGGHRAAGRQPRACAQGRHPSSRTAATSGGRGAATPRPQPADGGGALLRRAAPASLQKRGRTWPHGASAPPPQPASASAMRRAAGCGRPWSPRASPRSVIRDSGLFMERGAERFAGMVVVPDASGGLVRWLVGRAIDPDRTPRFQALPGPKPVLGLGRLGPASALGGGRRGASSTGSPLPAGAFPACAALGTQGVERVASPSGAAPASSSPSTTTTRGCEATERLLTLLGTQGRRRRPPPRRRRRGRACRPSPRTGRLPSPALTGGPIRPLAAPRRSSAGFPARPPHRPHSHHPGGPMPNARRALPAHGFP